jgi:hypothetical protein
MARGRATALRRTTRMISAPERPVSSCSDAAPMPRTGRTAAAAGGSSQGAFVAFPSRLARRRAPLWVRLYTHPCIVPELSPRRWQNAGRLMPLPCHSLIKAAHSADRRTLAMVGPPRWEHSAFHNRRRSAAGKDLVYRVDTLSP